MSPSAANCGAAVSYTHLGSPAAVCCTAGSALLNIHPAVSEAFYQQVPLVVISADRPGAWIGQMDGQTFPQPGVFGSQVKKSVNPVSYTHLNMNNKLFHLYIFLKKKI